MQLDLTGPLLSDLIVERPPHYIYCLRGRKFGRSQTSKYRDNHLSSSVLEALLMVPRRRRNVRDFRGRRLHTNFEGFPGRTAIYFILWISRLGSASLGARGFDMYVPQLPMFRSYPQMRILVDISLLASPSSMGSWAGDLRKHIRQSGFSYLPR